MEKIINKKYFKQKFIQSCLGLTLIPLGDASGWKELKFRSLPANKVSFAPSGIKIEVNRSASPLVFGFNSVQSIHEVFAEVEINGQMNPSSDSKSQDFEDDSYFRIGLIAKGEEIPNRIKMLFAPDWVNLLFSLAPKGVGLDKIYFYNMTSQEALLGKSRLHPKSKYIHEENVTLYKIHQKNYRISKTFSPPLQAAGVWISVDGDDTKSKFELKMTSLSYKPAKSD